MKEKNKTGRTAIVVGAGEFTDRGIRELAGQSCLIIAADGGLKHLQAAGLQPDLIIGDFDSLGYVPEKRDPEIIRLPVEKDDTDMAAACRTAWEKGFRSMRIYGGSGDRPDHFLANLQLAAAYSRAGAEVQMITPEYTVYAVTDGTVMLESEPGITFSVFSHGDLAEGVTIGGDVRYSLDGAQLTNTRALGVSNLMTGKTAFVSVRRGTLLVFLYHKNI